MNEFVETLESIEKIAPVTVVDCGGVQVCVSPTEEGPASIDLSRHDPRAFFTRADESLIDIADFCAYVGRFKTDDTVVFCKQQSATAIIDFIGAGNKPGKQDHQISVDFRQTDSFKRWLNLNDQLVAQSAFAEMVHQHRHELIEPRGAELAEMVQDMKLASKGEFRSAEDARSGSVDLVYNKTVNAGSKTGKVTVPKHFIIRVVPVYGMDPVELRAEFCYREPADGDTAVRVGYRIDQLDLKLEEIHEQIREFIEAHTQCPVYRSA